MSIITEEKTNVILSFINFQVVQMKMASDFTDAKKNSLSDIVCVDNGCISKIKTQKDTPFYKLLPRPNAFCYFTHQIYSHRYSHFSISKNFYFFFEHISMDVNLDKLIKMKEKRFFVCILYNTEFHSIKDFLHVNGQDVLTSMFTNCSDEDINWIMIQFKFNTTTILPKKQFSYNKTNFIESDMIGYKITQSYKYDTSIWN